MAPRSNFILADSDEKKREGKEEEQEEEEEEKKIKFSEIEFFSDGEQALLMYVARLLGTNVGCMSVLERQLTCGNLECEGCGVCFEKHRISVACPDYRTELCQRHLAQCYGATVELSSDDLLDEMARLIHHRRGRGGDPMELERCFLVAEPRPIAPRLAGPSCVVGGRTCYPVTWSNLCWFYTSDDNVRAHAIPREEAPVPVPSARQLLSPPLADQCRALGCGVYLIPFHFSHPSTGSSYANAVKF